MKNNSFKIALASTFVVLGLFAFAKTQAETVDQLTFPITELGDCSSAKSCKSYCNKLDNIESCVEFGVAHGLITQEQATEALKMKAIKEGPGDCTTKDACRTYCEDPAHTEECVNFAREHGLLSATQIQRFRDFHKALKDKDAPGACHDQHRCETFCFQRSNNEQCLKFAEENGLIDKARADKLDAFLQAVKEGKTPGGCDTKEECKEYCSNEEHRVECAEFGRVMGLITKADADKLKQGFVGPGGCKTREECQTFCNLDRNQQVCLDFARRAQILSAEQVTRIRNVVQEEFRNMPDALERCLKEVLGEELFNKIREGEFTPNATAAQQIQACMVKAAEVVRQEASMPMPGTRDGDRVDGSTPTIFTPTLAECIFRVFDEPKAIQIKAGTYQLTLEDKQRLMRCTEGMQTL